MSLQQQMIAANVRNWLMDLATGAKAMSTTMLCAPCEKGEEWRYEASTYSDIIVDGLPTVHVHNIKLVAEAAELELQHRTFKKGDYYYRSFEGEDFVVFNGVRFSDMALKEKKNDGK